MTLLYLYIAGQHGAFLHHGVHNFEQISRSRAILSKVNRLRYSASEINQSIARVATNSDVIIATIQSAQRTAWQSKHKTDVTPAIFSRDKIASVTSRVT